MRKIATILGIFISLNSYSQASNQELELLIIRTQYDSAIIVANQILENDSTNWQTHFYLGKSYQAKYKFFDAVRALEQANELDSANVIIENVLARAYDEIGKDEDAVNIYYDQYLRDTTLIEPIVNLANLFRKMREYGSAAHYYRTAAGIDPQNFYYFKQLGFCISKTNLPPKPAIFAYERAIGLNPYDLGMYQQLSNIYNSERFFGNAIITCNKGLRNFPDDNQLLKLKAYALYLNREFDSSIVVFNKLLEFGDSSFFNFKYRGLVQFEKSNFEKAAQDLEIAFELNSKDPETSFFLGSALGRSKNYEDGNSFLREAISLLKPPPNEMANIHSEIANNYLYQGMFEKSLEQLKIAYKFNATPLLSYKMGQLYDHYLNNKKMAIDCYDAYVTLANEPDSAELAEGVSDRSFFADPELMQNSKDRIRILKEELFFESAKKE